VQNKMTEQKPNKVLIASIFSLALYAFAIPFTPYWADLMYMAAFAGWYWADKRHKSTNAMGPEKDLGAE
jgi:hypothetical protein